MKLSKKNKHVEPFLSEDTGAFDPDTELIEETEYADDTVGYEPFERNSQQIEETDDRMPGENSASVDPLQEEKDEEERAEADNTSLPYLIKLAAVLTCICAVIAGMLAAVNLLTRDVIAENLAKEKQEAILSVFPAGEQVEEYTTAQGETVYIVLKDHTIIGYTVNVEAGGYVGPVDMMIGMTKEGKVCGIRILSMEETPGVGTKITGESFLNQFLGKNTEVVLGENVDAITGATFSSRAVEEGVNAALAIRIDLDEVAASLNQPEADAKETAGENELVTEPDTDLVPEEGQPETEAETAPQVEVKIIPTAEEPILPAETAPVTVEIIVPDVIMEETPVETVPETVPETEVETIPETVLEIVPETEPETIPETEPETEAETEPETKYVYVPTISADDIERQEESL